MQDAPQHHPPALLGAFDPHPVRLSNPEASSAFLLVSDHAGRRRPRGLGDLGVAGRDWSRHVACDLGIKGMGGLLARALDACLIEQRYSRLVIDCNRRPGHETSIPVLSERVAVPANENLSSADRRAREDAILEPYHATIGAAIARRRESGRETILVALHSFTPVWFGQKRPWHAAILHQPDDPSVRNDFARAVLARLAAEPDLLAGDNEPYRLTAASDYTVPRHAWAAGLDHVELEVRQDLIATEAGQAEWAARFARLLVAARRERT